MTSDIDLRAELRRLRAELGVAITQCGPGRAGVAVRLADARDDVSAALDAAGGQETATYGLPRLDLGWGMSQTNHGH